MHISCSGTLSESRAVCEIMWKSIVEPDRSQMTIWRMHFACWVTMATNSEYVMLIVLPLQLWLRKRISMLRYKYTACLALYGRHSLIYISLLSLSSTTIMTTTDNCDSCIMKYAISSIVSGIFPEGNKSQQNMPVKITTFVPFRARSFTAVEYRD